jgi:hypothetical protein
LKLLMLQAVRCAILTIPITLMAISASAEDRIKGRVEVGGAPIAGATVTAWLAGPGAPRKLVEATTDDPDS